MLKAITPTPSARERPGEWTQHPEYFAGNEALARNDPAAARAAFARVLAERPDQLDAKAGLARASFLLDESGAGNLTEEVLHQALNGTMELVRVTLEELGPAAEHRALRPTMAWRVAQRLDAAEDTAAARPYYGVASAADGLVGLKARVRALELDPEPDPATLATVAHATAREPELLKRVTALLEKFLPEEPRSIELPPEDTRLEFELRPSLHEPEAVAPAPRIVSVRIESRVEGGLLVVSPSGTNPLPFSRILGLALGVVPAADGRSTVLTDLIIGWAEGDKGATVLRAGLGDLGLDRLYPGVPPKEAYWRMVGDIEKVSGAKRVPPGGEGQPIPRYAGPSEMSRACYGAD
jgi:hypothetical protein